MVLISFREWLHSYKAINQAASKVAEKSSHLFQRVASFLHIKTIIQTIAVQAGSHLFQRVASFLQLICWLLML